MKAIRRFVESYMAVFAVRWAEMLQYRASVFIWTLWSLAGPVIHLSVWRSIANANGSVAGYGGDDIAAYFILQSIMYHFTAAWQAYEFSYLVRSGTLSVRLLKPFDPTHHLLANNVAFKLVNLIWLVPIWAALFLYFKPNLPLSFERALLFAAAVLAAGALQFMMSQVFAMFAFWTVRASAIFEISEAFGWLVGGGLAPVAFLPAVLGGIAPYLPFYRVIGFPIEVATGRVALDAALTGVLISLGWFAALFTLYRVLWRTGLKRYSAVGA